ncbi:MAG: DUF4124 domain-containing protein [Betaproteobacteria bacterium]|nr:MAG: DUF4124 domain-containing protein [Betaproteobacteria bacterium]
MTHFKRRDRNRARKSVIKSEYMANTGLQALMLLAVAAALSAMPARGAGLYKWTDDQGVVHYSDQMPADAMNKGSVVFDKKGRPVKKIDPALTPAQQKAKEAEEERQRAIARAQEIKTRRDTALLHSYTSEEEIEFARRRALSAIESQLKSAEEYTADLSRRQQELQKQKLAFAGKTVPNALETELAGIDAELARQATLLVQRKAELATLSAKYDDDKQRFRELRAEQQKSTGPASPQAGNAVSPPASVSNVKGASTTTK